MRIQFIVPSVPIAQPRTKVSSFGGKARAYTPKTVKSADGTRKPHPVHAFKATCRHAATLVYSGAPLQGPLALTVVFVLPRPQNMHWKTKPMPRAWHTSKPDSDNLQKSVKDALTKLLWVDDSQVCQTTAEKWIASGSEQPHVLVLIEQLETSLLPPTPTLEKTA